MDDRGDQDRLRAEEVSEELAIGKEEERMAREERELEREMKELEDTEVRTEQQIEEELRQEHSGHEPERPPRWPSRGS